MDVSLMACVIVGILIFFCVSAAKVEDSFKLKNLIVMHPVLAGIIIGMCFCIVLSKVGVLQLLELIWTSH